MLSALLKVRLQGVFASLFRGSKSKKRRGAASRVGMALLAVIVVLFIMLYMGMMFSVMAEDLHHAGLDWFYYALAGMAAAILSFLLSVFMAQQQLFEAKDNELLLSMPIPPAYIIGTRMLSIYLMCAALCAIVLIPAGVVRCIFVGTGVLAVLRFALLLILLPALVLWLTCLFGWLLALATSRLRNKTLVTLVLSLALMGAYFWFCFNLSSSLTSLLENSAAMAGSVAAHVLPAYAFGVAACGNIPALLGFAALCLLPCAALYFVLGREFMRLASAGKSVKRREYSRRALRTSSVPRALLMRELRRFGTNGTYILNAGIGCVMSLALGVLALINAAKLRAVAAMLPEGMAAAIAASCMLFLCVMDIISAPSLSLEGRSLWILKSLPLTAREILTAKVRLHLVISLPAALITSLCIVIALPFTALEAAGLILAPLAITLFCGYLGVCVNLHFPKLDYVNEAAVVKQSASVVVTMLAGIAAAAAPAVIYGVALGDVISVGAYLIICAAVYALGALLMHIWLGKGGAARFEAL